MAGKDSKSVPAIGFLTVVEQSELGLFGGYLVLNGSGRPLEFHCTAPVKANRAQEILYGPTLAPYLYGEQIGQTLISRAQVAPLFVCTDVAEVLAARAGVSMPLVLVAGERESADPKLGRLDAAHAAPPKPASTALLHFALGQQRAAVLAEQADDRELAVQRWTSHAESLDLTEPFSRIREAIAEAQRGAR